MNEWNSNRRRWRNGELLKPLIDGIFCVIGGYIELGKLQSGGREIRLTKDNLLADWEGKPRWCFQMQKRVWKAMVGRLFGWCDRMRDEREGDNAAYKDQQGCMILDWHTLRAEWKDKDWEYSETRDYIWIIALLWKH